MLSLIIRRLLLGIPNIILISVLLFFAVSGLLGTPSAILLGQDATPEAVADLDHRMGFDLPLLDQYVHWVGRALQGDFGRSFITSETVAEALLPRIQPSAELALLGIGVATIAAVFLNSLTVARAIVRPTTMVLSLIGITVPNFMLGISLTYIFSVELGWLPTTGWAPWSDGVWQHVLHLMLPVVTLSAYYFGSFGLVYRAEYRAVSRRLYIQVARAKGLSETAVSFKHVLPNSILPVITFIGSSLGQLTAGAVVTETVFSVPGLGNLFVNSILTRDFPVMLAIGMMTIVGVVVVNLIADLLYLVADPQIRLN